MNAKAKGSRAELEIVHLLEMQGYSCCKAGGSLGMWDIVAIGPHGVRLIQSKSNRPPPPVEMEAMQTFRCPPFCSRELWIRMDGERDIKKRWRVTIL